MRRLFAELGPPAVPAPLDQSSSPPTGARPGRGRSRQESTHDEPPVATRPWRAVPLGLPLRPARRPRAGPRGRPARSLLQPTAALVVFGGTLAAVLFSFPPSLLRRTWKALRRAFGAAEPEAVAADTDGRVCDPGALARGAVARARGRRHRRSVSGRALALAVDGASPADVRQVLEAVSQAREEADDECAQVLEAAAGYAPTLGILGAVLGLIHVMENLAEPAALGPASPSRSSPPSTASAPPTWCSCRSPPACAASPDGGGQPRHHHRRGRRDAAGAAPAPDRRPAAQPVVGLASSGAGGGRHGRRERGGHDPTRRPSRAIAGWCPTPTS